MSEVQVAPFVRALRTTGLGRRAMARAAAIFFAVFYLRMFWALHQERWLTTLNKLPPGARVLLLAPRAHGKTETAVSFVTQAVCEDRNIRVLFISKTADVAKKRLRKVKVNLESNVRIIRDYGAFKPKKLPIHLLGVYDETDPQKGKKQVNYWTERYIYVERPSNLTDPTVEAIGWRGNILGGRYDLVVLDDPIDDGLAQSEVERERAKTWFYGTVMELLEPNGRVVVIGTRKHHADLYSTLMEDTTFDLVHDRAVVKWPESYEAEYEQAADGRAKLKRIDIKGEHEVLWPERWPLKALLRKLIGARDTGTVSTSIWLRENQNEIKDDESSHFPMVFFKGGEHRPSPDMPARQLPGCYDLGRSFLHEPLLVVPPWDKDGFGIPLEELSRLTVEREARGIPSSVAPDQLQLVTPYPQGVLPGHLGLVDADLFLITTWDLSLVVDKDRAERRDTDYTVGLTWAVDRNTWTRYLVSMWRQRGLHPESIVTAIVNEYLRFGGTALKVVIESVLFQQVYELLIARRTSLPIVGHATGREKADPFKGIPYLSGLAEHGKLRFPYKTPHDRELTAVLTEEWHNFPEGKHDDTLLATHCGERKLALYERKVLGGMVGAAAMGSGGVLQLQRPEVRRPVPNRR